MVSNSTAVCGQRCFFKDGDAVLDYFNIDKVSHTNSYTLLNNDILTLANKT